VILDSARIGLTVMERDTADEAWRTSNLKAGDTLLMPEVGIAIPVSEFYEEITFPDQAKAKG
jgi:hypothetical protein